MPTGPHIPFYREAAREVEPVAAKNQQRPFYDWPIFNTSEESSSEVLTS
jgi:hypothetical protein